MSVNKMAVVQWARPVHIHPILHRSFLVAEGKIMEPKEFILCDEIIPTKNEGSNANKIQRQLELHKDTFHRAIGPVLLIGQCFGVMPIYGILCPDPSYLRFTWTSWRMFYAFLSLLSTVCMGVTSLLCIVYTGIDIYKTVSIIFNATTFLSLVLFLRLAPLWPMLAQAIAKDEFTEMPTIHWNSKRTRRSSLRSQFMICCFAVLSMALVEHTLCIVSGIAIATDCLNGRTPVESFFMYSYPQVFYFTSYELWKCPLLLISNLRSTLSWNFMDLFIIVVSLGLTKRFERLNDRLDAVHGKNLQEDFWRSAREEFAKLSRLVKLVDNCINEIILLSFANNLYFICIQLFQTLNDGLNHQHAGPVCGRSKDGLMRGFSHIVYSTFSFGFLMVRSVSVSLSAARLNSVSVKPAAVIYAVPSTSYCTEVIRFLEQVTTDVVALTGLNFFYVTRGLVLTIAGTIVTYELVLLQFSAPSPTVTANITIADSCGNQLKA